MPINIKIKHVVITFLVVLSFSSCKKNETKTQEVTVNELTQVLLKKNTQLIDVRTSAEYDLGHIENAQIIDVKLPNFKEKAIVNLDKSKPVYVYCRSGKRGVKACDILQKEGYKVYNLKGGYLAWNSKK